MIPYSVGIGTRDGAGRRSGHAPYREGVTRLAGAEIQVTSSSCADGLRLDVSLRNSSPRALAVDRVYIDLRPDMPVGMALDQGYQSWSPIDRRRVREVRGTRRLAPAMVRATYHADPVLAGRAVSGDQYLVTDAGAAGFLDAAMHLGTISVSPDGTVLRATALLDGVLLGPREERALDPLWFASGEPSGRYSSFAQLWGIQASARRRYPSAAALPGRRLLPGWCSWYQYLWNVTPDDVLANVGLARAGGLGVVQIDDGYEAAVGDWLVPNQRWAHRMEEVVGEIRGAGLAAGIWTAPFLAGAGSTILAEHPDWLVRSAGSLGPLKAMFNPVAWGGWAYALDTTRGEVLDHIRSTFATLVAQGFDYHKVDFCYAAALPGFRHDGRFTRAQALQAGLRAVREGLGDDSFLVGCGCPFGPAVGLVDAMRVSPDVAPRWSPGFVRYPSYSDAAPAASNSVRASVLRAPLHRRVFMNDPDCLLLRPTDTHLNARQRDTLAAAVMGCGGFAMVSDDLRLYGQEQWDVLDALRTDLDQLDTPLELEDPFATRPKVRSARFELSVDWRPNRLAGGPHGVLQRRGDSAAG